MTGNTIVMRENSTFCAGEPFWANACVGNNGRPDYYDYAKGFSEAANLLIKAALHNNGCKYSVDIFIYPICFNMRHSVELRLKGAVELLTKISTSRVPLSPFDLVSSHDIGRIWEYVKSESDKIDKRLGFYIGILDEYILDLADVDATGQVFRYPYNKTKEKHLTEIGNINVAFLYKRFHELEAFLDSFDAFIQELKVEHSWGTYTKNLTRSEILEIARILPSKDKWICPEFKSLKDQLKLKYSISSNELSIAIEKIKNLYRTRNSEFSAPELKFLELIDIEKIIESWVILHPHHNSKEPAENQSIDFSDTEGIAHALALGRQERAELDRICNELVNSLNDDKLSDINAIYETGRSLYPECYPFLVTYYQGEVCAGSYDYPEGRVHLISRLLKRPDFLDSLLRCLYLIGHKDTAETIITKFGLIDSIDWIKDARKNEFFVAPCDRILASCLSMHEKNRIKNKSSKSYGEPEE